MAPGRKAGTAKTEQCPHCQQFFAPGGSFTNHKRACEKAKARGESASRLAMQFAQVNDPLQGIAGVPPEERHQHGPGHGVHVLHVAPDVLNAVVPQPDAFAMPMAHDGYDGNAPPPAGDRVDPPVLHPAGLPPFPLFPAPNGLQPPSGGFVVDDFVTVTHPSANVPIAHARFEDFNRSLPDVDPAKLSSKSWAPAFQSLEEFQFAELALELGMNKEQVDRFLALIDVVRQGATFTLKKHGDVMNAWDRASDIHPDFKSTDITVPYLREERTFTIFYRPLFDWGLKLAEDPILAPKFVWNAQRLYKFDGSKWVRFIDEPWTADLFWNIQVSITFIFHSSSYIRQNAIPRVDLLYCFILYADKTRLSSFGGQKGYPIFVRLANLPAEIRNSEGYGGGQLVGLLPIVEDEDEEGKLSFTTLKRVVWHEGFWLLIQTVAKWASIGYKVQCDYEEQ
ncbi:hypothetical protein GSI_09120 [Ganoderma sinense ZZ0214-1]|uniref:Uncharacterized protein n=1 Tax=Ganoderma sinense ZZ0214-1 TaxID=1077348 RepID=A0A2G8S5L9_9APHY|nr:hypothetical protein GSI_09120 [Ganoderma sinense ZZ0214-1]